MQVFVYLSHDSWKQMESVLKFKIKFALGIEVIRVRTKQVRGIIVHKTVKLKNK